MTFLIDNATPLLWGLGTLYLCVGLVIWSCLAMSKRCEGEE